MHTTFDHAHAGAQAPHEAHTAQPHHHTALPITTMEVDDAPPAAYSWETFERSWEAVREAPDGSLRSAAEAPRREVELAATRLLCALGVYLPLNGGARPPRPRHV